MTRANTPIGAATRRAARTTSDPAAGEPLYQVFCLLNTPPTSFEEQQLCLASRTCCWRLAAAEARPAAHPVERSRGTKRPA